jgi:hypothetical protein
MKEGYFLLHRASAFEAVAEGVFIVVWHMFLIYSKEELRGGLASPPLAGRKMESRPRAVAPSQMFMRPPKAPIRGAKMRKHGVKIGLGRAKMSFAQLKMRKNAVKITLDRLKMSLDQVKVGLAQPKMTLDRLKMGLNASQMGFGGLKTGLNPAPDHFELPRDRSRPLRDRFHRPPNGLCWLRFQKGGEHGGEAEVRSQS